MARGSVKRKPDDDEPEESCFDDYLSTLLTTVSTHAADDTINDCDGIKLGDLENKAQTLFDLADQKIHVFPFSKVKSCWFRLYTDASVVRAVHCIRTRSKCPENDTLSSTDLQDVVSILDMAIITAGGLGREQLIAEFLAKLQDFTEREKEKLSSNSQHSEQTAHLSRPDLLPQRKTSIPVLGQPVDQFKRPGMERFVQWMHDSRKPVKLLDILDHWPALTSWKQTSYWLDHTFGGRRLVPVELGRSYVDDDWAQKIMPFDQFLDDYILAEQTSDSKTGYLAQHDLFRQLPSLETSISTPDYCYLEAPGPEPGSPLYKGQSFHTSHIAGEPPSDGEDEGDRAEEVHDVHRNIWFGPSWTVTPLHHDPYHNILCQVVGTKYVRLYSPHDSNKLRPMSDKQAAPHEATQSHTDQTIDMSNTSTIDVAAMELSPHEDWDATYPGISDVAYFECVLEAGEALYVPIGWWHYVRSCSVGMSVSFWWK